MLFAKGEIIMNNIYKVIWSKAKNCYVVASEIARSHTKSASGSEKIGGGTRRKLLASLMALSLLCGGLGVASATLEVLNQSGTTGAVKIYTKEEVDNALKEKGLATDVATNKANIAKLQEDVGNVTSGLTQKVTEQGEKIATNITNIDTNKANIAALQSELGNKADNSTVTTALEGKANKADVYSKKDADNTFATKTELDAKADKTALDGKADITYVDQKLTEAGNNVETKLANYATTAYVDGKITGEENARDIAIQTAISGEAENRKNAIDAAIAKEVADRNQAIKIEVDKEANARNTAIANAKNDLQTKITEEKTAREALDTRLTKAEDKITANETAIDNLKTKDTENVKYDNATVKDQITLGGTGGTKITNLKDADLSDSSSDAVTGKQLNKTNKDLKTEAQTRQDMDTLLSNRADALEKNTGGITRNDAKDETYIEKNVTVDNQGNIEAKGKVTANGVDAGVGDITTKGAVNSGTLEVTNTSHFKDDVTMDNKLNVTGNTSLNNTDVGGALNVTGASDLKGNVTLGTPNGANTVTVNGTANFNAPVNMANGLNVTNGETKLKNTTVTGDLNVTGTITTDTMVFGVKPTNYTEIDQGKVTSKNSYINGAGQSITSSSTFDVEKNEVGFVNNATGEQSYHKQTAKGINGSVTDKDGNKTYTKVTATENSFQVQDKDGKNTNHQVNTKDSSVTEITDKNGATTTKTQQTAKDITNTAEQGTITNKAQTIVNNATGDMTNTVGGQLNTTVTGQATEEFNGGLDTNVTGTENHTVTGNQNIHVTKNQTNKIDGDQENTIGGKQTTTVDGKVTENYKAGQETNVTGDQDIKVSGTQTTTATDINRNASSGMIDTVENASGSNKETKVAGQTTTDVKLASGEEGHYIRGATESRDYLLNGTLKNSETKTAEATSSEVTDGTNKASTIQDAKNLAGSVTNGTETGISGIHANNDGSVSIDSIVVGGGMSSVINQKKDSIQSAVGDGTNSTVIRQDKDNVAIASSNGTVAIAGKDIVNNASHSITEKVGDTNVTEKTTTSSKSEIQNADTITSVQQTESMVQSYVGKKDGSATNVTTNFANASANQVTENGQTSTVLNNKDGLLIRNTANGSSFTTDNGTNTGSALEWTNVKGNEISTGKVEANYVKMDYADVMRDLGVRGNANITGKTTTGSLEVTGTSTLKGDVTMEKNATVKNNLNVEGITTTKTLSVTENATVGGTLDVTGKATFKDSVSIAKDLSVGGDVTAKSYKVGDKTYISAAGINANDQKITNVADGSISEGSKDAVNGGQLYQVKNDLEGKVNKVGANAAAMANLHPMEFDPDSKWNIAAAMGNYGSETATAIGAFYRPNEDVMVNFSTAFGTGENMVGGGVSVRLGKGSNKLSRQESNALKAQVNDLTARMDALLSVLNPNMSKNFPDVPENHWAYEAVSRLAGNDIVQGYPDGEFHGERTMTRYEMAEIIYNALSRGAEAEKELVEEFKPELQAMAASEKATAERAEG